MADCQVLRCFEKGTEVRNLKEPPLPPKQVALCMQHADDVDSGGRWFLLANPGVNQPNALYMGDDAPPLIDDASVGIGHLSNLPGSKLVKLKYQDASGNEETIEFEIPEDVAENLSILLTT